MGVSLKDIISGKWMTGDEDKKAQKYLDQSISAYDGLTPPELSPVELENYNWLGDLRPEEIGQGQQVGYNPIDALSANFSEAGPSAYEHIQVDPRLQDQQMASLAALQDIASSGGLTAADRAQLSRIQTEASTADRGRRDAIGQNMASRGMGGSGLELLAQLQSSQGTTDRQAQEGLDVAGMAQQRALDAMMQSGQLAGNIQGQQFDQKSRQAEAQDAIARFNAANRNQMNQFNTGQTNQMGQFNAGNQLKTGMYNADAARQAQMFNAQARQDASQRNMAGQQQLANSAVDQRNNQTMYNKTQLPQQQFDNQFKIAAGKSGALAQGTGYWDQQSGRMRDQWGNIIAGGSKVGAAAATGGGKTG